MARHPLPPVAAVISFVDRINRGDPDGLGELMTEDHRLVVLDEPPLVGRSENVEAWRHYLAAYDRYVIQPRQIAVRNRTVAVLGSTAGSHLDLPDREEIELTVIWLAEVQEGLVCSWQIVDDLPEIRARVGLS